MANPPLKPPEPAAPAEWSAARDWARRLTLLWAPVLVFAGTLALIYLTSIDNDPCCHFQAPGIALAVTGGVAFYKFLYRRDRFGHLLLLASSVHEFREHEEELDDLSRHLPRAYREVFRKARLLLRDRTRRWSSG